MKKDVIIYTLIGIIVCLLVALTIILVVKKDNYVVIDTDEELVNNFSEIAETNNENKIKKGFNDIVDFIFHEKKIKGKTFSELKDDTKVKLLDIALSIDKKIDDYFPNYKGTLKEKYKNIKIKIVETYINIVNKICDSNSSFCDNFKSDFNNMKEKFGITFDYLKKYGSIGFEKVKDWFQDLKD